MKKKLMALSALGGISGFEFSITEHIKGLLEPYCDTVEADAMGNVMGVIYGRNKNAGRVMLEAHIDVIGLMVAGIDDTGFISFVPIGGVDSAVLPGAEVMVCGREELFGVIGAKPPHLQTEKKMATQIEDLYIDVGLPAERVRELVCVGDMIYFAEKPAQLSGKVLSGKGFDDRAGLISLLICLLRI